MERKIYQDLLKWKNDSARKPLILQGARQVGKTYIVNYFAGKEYANCVYCNFEKEKGLEDFFKDLNPTNIIRKLSSYKRKEILPEKTLIIFDEVQACPQAITSLKYWGNSAKTSTGWPSRGCWKHSWPAWRHWLLWPSSGFLWP